MLFRRRLSEGVDTSPSVSGDSLSTRDESGIQRVGRRLVRWWGLSWGHRAAGRGGGERQAVCVRQLYNSMRCRDRHNRDGEVAVGHLTSEPVGCRVTHKVELDGVAANRGDVHPSHQLDVLAVQLVTVVNSNPVLVSAPHGAVHALGAAETEEVCSALDAVGSRQGDD